MGKIERANKKAQKELNKQAKLDVKKIKKEIKSDINSSIDKKEKRNIRRESYKRYTSVYLLYGKEFYLRNVPKKIRKKDLYDLYEDGRFITIYEKHGEEAFRKVESKILSKDVEYETGNRVKGELYEIKKSFKDTMKKGLATLTGIVIGGNGLALLASETERRNQFKKNVQEISEYVNSINEYAENIKKMNLTDTEIIMKVMDDMWNSIDGYGEPKKDILGYFGVDMSDENRVGVCRNMSDDFARKVNAINPKYNARIIAVYATMDADNIALANIERTEVSSEEKDNYDETDTDKITPTNVIIGIINGVIESTVGNHTVVLMDIPEDNTTLIVDPTNPAIGIYKNGDIQMFNSKTEDAFVLDRKLFGEEVLCGTDSQNLPKEYIGSFLPCKLSDEELKEKYGVEAQNKALGKLRIKNADNLYEELRKYYSEQGIDVEQELYGNSNDYSHKEYDDEQR